MHGLQAVARIRQRPAHDHAHRVIEIGTAHFLDDGNGLGIGWQSGLSAAGLAGIVGLVRQESVLSEDFNVKRQSYPILPSEPNLHSAKCAKFTFIFNWLKCHSTDMWENLPTIGTNHGSIANPAEYRRCIIAAFEACKALAIRIKDPFHIAQFLHQHC